GPEELVARPVAVQRAVVVLRRVARVHGLAALALPAMHHARPQRHGAGPLRYAQQRGEVAGTQQARLFGVQAHGFVASSSIRMAEASKPESMGWPVFW